MRRQGQLTKRGARRGTAVESFNGGENEDESEKKSEEKQRIKHHLIRESSRTNLHFYKLSQSFPCDYRHMSQARRYMQLHLSLSCSVSVYVYVF